LRNRASHPSLNGKNEKRAPPIELAWPVLLACDNLTFSRQQNGILSTSYTIYFFGFGLLYL